MAEIFSKRQRDETRFENSEEDPKRLKSYNQILAILEDDEDESNDDLSSILATLQQELSCDSTRFPHPLPGPTSEPDPEYPTENSTASDCSSPTSRDVSNDDEERETVMRRLLEASDDELGLPHKVDGGDDDDGMDGGDCAFGFAEGLWEFEDEAANYSLLMQSELFMY